MQNVSVLNKHKEKLAGYLFEPPTGGSHMIVICHGFRGTKANGGKIYAFAKQLQALGIGVLVFDFSGSGDSEGDFVNATLSRQAEDLHSIIDFVNTEFNLPIILMGRSFGGSTVLAGSSADASIAGYIFWSVPVHLEPAFRFMLPDTYQLLQAGETITIKDEAGEFRIHSDLIRDFDHFDAEGCLLSIKSRPVLIIQASDDEVVDPDNAHYMKERLDNCRLFMVEQAGHRFQDKTALRESITLQWLSETFK